MMALIILMLLFNPNLAIAGDNSFSDLFGSYKQTKESVVVKVISSDTVVLEDGTHVKLIGIESYGPPPRTYVKFDKYGKPIEEPVEPTIPLEEQAFYYAQEILENKKVTLEYDIDALDDRHQRQAYIFLPGGSLANALLLKQGFVRLKIRPPNLKHAQELRDAYQEAKVQQRGFLSN